MTLAEAHERHANAIAAEARARTHRYRVVLRLRQLANALERAQLDLDRADDLFDEAKRNTEEARLACERMEFESSMRPETAA